MGKFTDADLYQLSPNGTALADPVVAAQRAAAFTAQALSHFRSVTLLVTRQAGTQTTYLATPPGPASPKAAELLAGATGASAKLSELPEGALSGSRAVRQMRFLPLAGTFRETQNGADPAEQARLLAAAMSDGQWLAISLRRPGQLEYRRHNRWLKTRMATFLPTHHSLAAEAVIGSFYAGAADGQDADALLRQVAAAMPGFDLPVRSVPVPGPGPAIAAWVAGAVASIAFVVLPGLWPVAASLLGSLGAGPGLASAVFCLAVAAAIGRGLLPVRGYRNAAARWVGLFPPPKHYEVWRGRWTPPSKGEEDDGRQVKIRQGNYPTSHASFVLGPQLPVLLVSPHAGAVSGQAATGGRPVPPVMRSRIGPLIGQDPEGNPVYLPLTDSMPGGTFITGRMGSGKSELLRGIYAWTCLDRVAPSGLPGALGAAQALVAFESKGEGAAEYLAWARQCGDQAALIEVADPDSWAIAMLDFPGTWAERGAFFADMLKYVLDDGAVGPSSFMALASFATAALALTETAEGRAVLAEVDGLEPDIGLMDLVYVLVGGRGDELAVALDAEVGAETVRLEKLGSPSAALATARDQLAPYYAGKPPSHRREAVSPPRNKIYALLLAGSWWSGRRPSVTWDQVLCGSRSLIVNTGPSVMKPGLVLAEEVTDQIAGMLMFSLQRAIMRNCASWGQAGRGVAIFADELALLAGSDPRVITWLHDQGRSFGIRTCFATQRAGQLDEKVRASAMDYSTLIAFRQGGAEAAAPIAADLAADGSLWEIADMINLPPYTAAVRTTAGQQRQAPFTVKATYWAADMAGFARAQGW